MKADEESEKAKNSHEQISKKEITLGAIMAAGLLIGTMIFTKYKA